MSVTVANRSSLNPGSRGPRYRASRSTHERLPFRWFITLLVPVLGGYLFFGRPFAYLHIPGTPVYIGEIVLAVGLIEAVPYMKALRAIVRQHRPLQILLAFMAVGALRMLWDLPEYGLDAVRDSAPWYYGLFAILAALAVQLHPGWLSKLSNSYCRIVPFFLLWAPMAIVLKMQTGLPNVPGSSTPINAFKPNDVGVFTAMMIASVWVLHSHGDDAPWLRPALTVIGVGGLLMAASQGRSGFVSAMVLFGVVLVVWRGRRRMLGMLIAAVALLVALAAASDIRIETGGRDMSVDQLMTNVESLIAPEDGTGLSDTVEWRTSYWTAVLNDALSWEYAFIGQGYGPILADRYGYQGTGVADGQPLRSVHNSHLTILARGGVVAAALWLVLWGYWFALQRRWLRIGRTFHDITLYSRSALVIGVAAALLTNAVFDPTLEGPQVGIVLWVLFGIGVALPRGQTAMVVSAPNRLRRRL